VWPAVLQTVERGAKPLRSTNIGIAVKRVILMPSDNVEGTNIPLQTLWRCNRLLTDKAQFDSVAGDQFLQVG
jgi:hypothetical protein